MKRALLAVLLLSLALPARADRHTALAHFEKARELYVLEDYDGALRELQAGYAEDPDPDFLYNIGKAYQKQGRVDPAVRNYRLYLGLAPRGQYRGQAEQRLQALAGRSAAGIPPAPLQSVPRRHGSDTARSHYEKARRKYVNGQYDAAIGELGAGFELGSDPDFLYNIGKAQQKAGRPDKALQVYRSYLEIAPQGHYAGKAREQIEQLSGGRQPAQGEASAAVAPDGHGGARAAREDAREPRPRWRLLAGGTLLGAGAPLLGTGIAGLAVDGQCSAAAPPMSECRQVYDTLAIGAGLTAAGAALVLTGALLLALPGKRTAAAVTPFFSSRGPVLGLVF